MKISIESVAFLNKRTRTQNAAERCFASSTVNGDMEVKDVKRKSLPFQFMKLVVSFNIFCHKLLLIVINIFWIWLLNSLNVLPKHVLPFETYLFVSFDCGFLSPAITLERRFYKSKDIQWRDGIWRRKNLTRSLKKLLAFSQYFVAYIWFLQKYILLLL